MCRTSIYEARNNLSNFVKIAERGEPVELTRYDKPVAVIISYEEYEKMEKPSFLEKLAELKKIAGVKILNQTNNKEAKQEREKGFCECIIVDENELKLEQTFEKIKTICTNSSTE